MIAALAPSLFSGDEEAVPSGLDTTPSVADGEPGTDRPANREPADTTTTPVIMHSGYEQLIVTFNDVVVDLDSSTDGTGGDNIADLVLTEFALTAGGSALITLLDRIQIPTLDVCRSALEEGGVDTIPAAQIKDGDPLCVKTTAGRIGALTRTGVGKGGDPPQISYLFFDYVIWKALG
ncbi:MAG: hypothetical protein ACRDTF_11595 [Pseudonocardiaceae bacterium]